MTLRAQEQTNNPDPVIHFFKLDFTKRLATGGSGPSALYFTPEVQNITFAGQVYTPIDVDFSPAPLDLTLTNPTATLIISGQYTALLDALNNYDNKIEGSELVYYQTHRCFLDDGIGPDTTQVITETYTIDSIKEKSKSRIEFDLTIGLGTANNNGPGLRSFVNG